jgi:hypothetical protein
MLPVSKRFHDFVITTMQSSVAIQQSTTNIFSEH